MKRFAACLVALALLAPPATQARERRGDGKERGRPRQPYANPSAAIAAEIALNRLAREKGQWTAFLVKAAPEAEMFVPQRVLAETWLKRRPNPAQPATWQPQAVWASCDGSTAVTQGAWQAPGGKQGVFITVWQRQPKKGDYRWVLNIGGDLEAPLEAPEAIAALVAGCDGPPLPAEASLRIRPDDDAKTARSRDNALRWTTVVRADGTRRFRLTMRSDGAAKDVVDLSLVPQTLP